LRRLALTYAVTLAGYSAVSLPVRAAGNGVPFGLRVVGPHGAAR
jgi:Asp-tRNA(Asn)/Glu-tRNA(Gln) amidotransferase A subunit family amidase